jgi:hypothetical protein
MLNDEWRMQDFAIRDWDLLRFSLPVLLAFLQENARERPILSFFLEHAMAIPKSTFLVMDVYKKISSRFWDLHKIRLDTYIDSMVLIGPSVAEGVTFLPTDSQDFVRALEDTGVFFADDRRDPIQGAASAATTGTGYREKGRPSLHCQVGKSVCNVHLDQYGFVVQGPDGQSSYNPDLAQHIIDELLWGTFVVGAARKLSETLGNALARVHPTVSNSENGYKPTVGGRVDVVNGQSPNGVARWRISIDVSQSCRDMKCRQDETYFGVSIRFER